MSFSYPGGLDQPSAFGTPAGTSPLTSPDHAASHTDLAGVIGTIEYTIGTTGGTNVLKNFTAGKLAVFNTGGTLDAGVLGTPMIRGGTLGTVIVGTSTVQGGTVNDVVLGSAAATGGTFNSINLGTPAIVGGSIAGSGTVLPISFGVGIAPSAGSFADSAGGTFTVNAATAQIYFSAHGTAAGNRTIATPLNPTAWQSLNYAFRASGSANATIIWSSGFGTGASLPQALGTGTSWSYYSFRYNPVSSKWDFQGNSISVGI